MSRGDSADFIPAGDMARMPAAARIGYGLILKIPVVRNMGKLLRYRF